MPPAAIATRERIVLRRAVSRAILAPSIHNIQPWRFHLGPDGLRLYADRSRQLSVLDPAGRQLTISCGCALFNARVALAAEGVRACISRLPDADDPDLLAVLRASPGPAADGLAGLDSLIELRRTNRKRFADEPVPEATIHSAVGAAEQEDAVLVVVRTLEHRLAIARLAQQADALDALRTGGGSSSLSTYGPRADVPLSDLDFLDAGLLSNGTSSGLRQCLLVLCTRDDQPRAWLRAGEALEHVLLEFTRRGFVATPLTQITQVPITRSGLRDELALDEYPHLLLCVGLAPAAPATRRRRIAEVITESG